MAFRALERREGPSGLKLSPVSRLWGVGPCVYIYIYTYIHICIYIYIYIPYNRSIYLCVYISANAYIICLYLAIEAGVLTNHRLHACVCVLRCVTQVKVGMQTNSVYIYIIYIHLYRYSMFIYIYIYTRV